MIHVTPPFVVRKVHPKTKFSPDEDTVLTVAVQQLGTSDWQRIAEAVSGRNARQCRDRWLNYLSPDVGNGPWTSEDDQLLLSKYEQFGPAWRRIASFFEPGRTEINVKSRWLRIQRQNRKRMVRGELIRGLRIPFRIPVPPPPPPPNPLPVPQLGNTEREAPAYRPTG
jgi:hypothetical protein